MPQQQLQSIQAMLAAGHRCAALDRHSIFLWGLVGGGLIAFTDLAINIDRFPDLAQRATAMLVWLALWLGGMSWLDYRLTHRARQAREETLPFAQAQITRVWWMLLALGALCSFAMFFHGGGVMIYALWTVLLGLGIFFFGLFSRPLIEWIGLATVLLGIAGLTSGMPMNGARWLAASCFAVGLPFAGWLTARTDDSRTGRRALAVALWLAVVIAPALAATRLAPTAPATPMETLTLPVGTVVPMYVDLDSALLAIASDSPIPVRISRPTEISLSNGQPDGRYRVDGGDWHTVKEGLLALHIDRIQPKLAAGQPEIRMHGDFHLQEKRP